MQGFLRDLGHSDVREIDDDGPVLYLAGEETVADEPVDLEVGEIYQLIEVCLALE